MRLAIFLAAMVLGSGGALAFDCTGVKLPSSIVICSDPELIRLADERQQAFNEARWGIDPQRDKELLADQTGWVRSYATACGVPPNAPPPDPVPATVKECFKRAAEARVAYIRAYGATGPSAAAQPAPAAAQTTPTAPASTINPGYRAALSAWLDGHKHYPDSARQRGEEGRAMLRFRVARSGRVLNYAVVQSTGYPDLDAAVETMMRGASLPPFPADMTASDVEVSVTIGFGLQAGTVTPAEAVASPPLRPGTVAPGPQPGPWPSAPTAQAHGDENTPREKAAGDAAYYACFNRPQHNWPSAVPTRDFFNPQWRQEFIRHQCIEEGHAAVMQFRAEAAERQAAVEKQKANARRIETLASRGYATITIKDFKLDGRELAASGKRIAISGYYYFLAENAEYLHSSPQLSGFGHVFANADDGILILTDNATRPARAAFLDCRQNGVPRDIGCSVNIIGHATTCEMVLTRLKRPCIEVEDLN